MGIIGDSFKKLFFFLSSLFSGLFGVIWDGIKWLGNTLKKLFQNLVDILLGFFNVIYALIDGFLYLLYMIGVVAVKLFLVMFEAGKVLFSLMSGFARTLSSLNYTPRTGSGNGYSEIIGKLFNNLSVLQIDSIAYILLFILWFVTAKTAIALIGSMRSGG